MKRVLFFLMVAAPLWAQAAVVDTKPSIQSENLAPMTVTAAVSSESGLVAGVSVTLPETDGFARDVALTEAARKALPIALGQLETPLTGKEAESAAKAVGEPMQFVKSYRIVKELLVPSYSLTVDMVFDVPKLQANFGKRETTTTTTTTTVSTSWSTGTIGPVASVSEMPIILKVEAKGAAGQDKLFNTLSKAGLKPVWKLITREGGELVVSTSLGVDALRDKVQGLGFNAEVLGNGLVVRP